MYSFLDSWANVHEISFIHVRWSMVALFWGKWILIIWLCSPPDTTSNIKILSKWTYNSSKLSQMRFRILNWKNFYTTAAYHLQLLTRKQQQLRIEKQIAIAYIFKSGVASTLSEQPPSRGIRYCILSTHHQGRPISSDSGGHWFWKIPERLLSSFFRNWKAAFLFQF